jgi:hypothetical protein
MTACHHEKVIDVPDQMVGIWVTDNQKYEDCFVKLTKTMVYFRTKDGEVDSYEIKKVTEAKNPKIHTKSYTITYKNEDGLKYEMTIDWKDKEKTLSFKDQKDVIWEKVKVGVSF